jgi:hypothetical protein
MGSGASGLQDALKSASVDDIKAVVATLSPEDQKKVERALCGTNAAFVFIKPHANTEAVKTLAQEGLKAKGIRILSEGALTGAVIDEKKLIDQHYYAIAVKATIKKPSELNVPNDKFKEQFGIDWKEALDSGKVFNALDGCKEFGCDATGMATAWDEAKEAKKLVKLGGGFYCGLLKVGEKELYIMNGFFMSMRSKFTSADASIYYYVCEWDPSDLSWADFRGKVLGPTDPAQAPKDSLRGQIFEKWESLGLKAVPNTGDNGMHASASPFEGLAERANWLEAKIGEDSFGKQLLGGGMDEAMIKDWSVDPQVKQADGKMGSIFDALEDMDAKDCLAKLLELSKCQ